MQNLRKNEEPHSMYKEGPLARYLHFSSEGRLPRGTSDEEPLVVHSSLAGVITSPLQRHLALAIDKKDH